MSNIVVVTGGASGIGLGSAKRLAALGWTPVILDREQAVERLRNPGEGQERVDFAALACDVASPQQIRQTFRAIGETYGRIDALVCSAGVFRSGALDEMSVEDFDTLFAVNTRGAWLCAREAVPLLKGRPEAEGPARIVLIGSVSGLRPKIGSGAYAASKEALHVLTRVMAVELAPERILVNGIAPGTTDTPMTQAQASDPSPGKFRLSGTSPLGRTGKPEDIAKVVEFLVGEQSSYVTGVIVPVDGGTRAAFVAGGGAPKA